MPQNTKKPKLRFKGFTDDWEQRKLEEVFDMNIPNNTLSRAELNLEYGEVQNIHYGDILVKYGAFIDASSDEIPFITNGFAEQFKSQFLRDGDVIFADTAEDETTGKAAEIGNLGDCAVVSGLHTIVCRPIEEKAKYYLGYYLNSDAFHFQLISLMQGIKVLSISKNNLMKTSIRYPKQIMEQSIIGSFFHYLDHLITLHQRKLDKLKNIKKSMLEKMFPKNGSNVPEIRFKGFTDDWEQRKLSDIVEIYSGLTYTPKDVREFGTLVIRSSNVNNNEIIDADNVYVNPNVVNVENVKTGDIIVVVRNGSRALIGKHAQIRRFMPHTVIGAFMAGMRSHCPTFTNALLDTHHFDNEVSKNMGATINQITGYMFSKMEFLIPKIEEQEKIGKIFTELDNLITIHQRKLEKLQNIKKACLEKMFV